MRTFLLRLLRPLFALLATLGFLSPALAQMNIEITGVGQSLYPIAVMRFEDENYPSASRKSFGKT
jgi:TolB protein